MADIVQQLEEKNENKSLALVKKIKSLFVKLLILSVVGASLFLLYKNPSLLQQYLPKNEEKTEQNMVLLEQINQLQAQIDALQSQVSDMPKFDITPFEEKVASLEKQSLNVIDSKADASIVLGMLTRVDKLESRLDKLSKISDDGALILSAAMLVKQSAEEGGSFVYEAEILNQLVSPTASIKKDVSLISEFAANGVISKDELIHKFKKLYDVYNQPEDDGKDWKERLNNKINEYIKISKKGDSVIEDVADDDFEKVSKLVFAGEIKKAVILIESSEADDIKHNEQLQAWLVDAKNMISFNQAIRNIAAYSLAEMKVNNLKNKE